MYAQITQEERYAIAAMRRQHSIRAIARDLGRSPSTISREIRRNVRADGGYRAFTAGEHTRARRSYSRRNTRFSVDDWVLVEHLIGLDWSPEQVSGWLKLHGFLSISYETIYLRIFADKRAGGDLWRHLRQSMKKRRKRYRSHDSRGRLAGKRHISERPPEVESREVMGHWEIDTMKGDDQARHTVLTMVERVSGYTMIGKLARGTRRPKRPDAAWSSSHSMPVGSTRSPPTTGASSTATRRSRPRPAWSSTSRLRTTPGSGARMRTRTGSSASTCRSGRAWRT
jgi:IS30 family transposase